LTAAEIAEKCSVHHNTVLYWIREGYLPALRVGKGGYYRVVEKDFIRFRETYLEEA
jgi:excisionase family DNA binding protein